MTKFSQFVSSVYSTSYVTALLTFLKHRHVAYLNAFSMASNLSPIFATTSFSALRKKASAMSSACDLGAKPPSLLGSVSN